MLLVVLGAGASYDSVPSYPAPPPPSWAHDGLHQRPPLANDLFDQRELFLDTVSRLPQMLPILPRLRHRAGVTTVETTLQEIQAEGARDPERYRQLTAVRYYLHYTLFRISSAWQLEIVNRHGSNYHSLLDRIRHYRRPNEPVALVTFNYDTLLEAALTSLQVPTDSVGEYIAHDVYKLFKLHGSIRWAHPITTPIVREGRNFYDILGEIIQRTPELEVGSEFVNVPNHLLADVGHTHLYAAIAIPLQEKNEYECPSDHLELLAKILSTVTRALIVGWSAMEAHFLRLLAERLPQRVHGLVVCGGTDGANATIERLKQAGIDVVDFRAFGQGFTQFCLGSEIGDFLRNS